MNTLRSVWMVAFIAAGAFSSQGASAALEGDAIYTGKFSVPAFVPDVRAVIISAATGRQWKLIDNKPGELTFELRHVKTHMVVVAKALYSQSEFSFRKVSASTFDCEPSATCQVDPAIVQRWMISLRREAGVALLRLAIQDAGGTLPAGRAEAAVEPDQG